MNITLTLECVTIPAVVMLFLPISIVFDAKYSEGLNIPKLLILCPFLLVRQLFR